MTAYRIRLPGVGPRNVLRLMSVWLICVSAMWLCAAFVAYVMLESSLLSPRDTEALSPVRLGVVVSICISLFLVFACLGIGIGSYRRWAWRHLQAASTMWMALGIYLACLWLVIAPRLNARIIAEGRLSQAEVEIGSWFVAGSITFFLIVMSIVTLALMRSRAVARFVERGDPARKPEYSLSELVLLWGFWGMASLALLGVLFDARVAYYGEVQWGMRLFWLVVSVLMLFAGACIFLRRSFWILLSLATMIVALAFALLGVFRSEGFVSLPEDPILRLFVVSAFVYFGVLYTVGMLFNLLRLHGVWPKVRLS